MREEKRSEIILDALNALDDEMIKDVENLRGMSIKKKKSPWRKLTAMAAGICVFVICGWMASSGLFSPVENTNERNENTDEDITEITGGAESLRAGVTIPQMELDLGESQDGVAADMLGFFILNGRSYIQYEFHQDYAETESDFVGDYVGHITGTIDEWTEADGYVDGVGTYTGNVYEVKGISPEFMLCMVWENGWVETFIHHNDITLYKGADLVDEWLDLRGNYKGISFEKIVKDTFTYDMIEVTDEEVLVFDQFLDAFAETDFVYVEEKINHPWGGDFDTPDMMDFYFVKENGVRLRFRTLGDGYISFPWLDACIQIDENLYNELVDVLTRYSK